MYLYSAIFMFHHSPVVFANLFSKISVEKDHDNSESKSGKKHQRNLKATCIQSEQAIRLLKLLPGRGAAAQQNMGKYLNECQIQATPTPIQKDWDTEYKPYCFCYGNLYINKSSRS